MSLRADEADKLSAALARAAQATAEEAKVKRWAAELNPQSRMDVTLRWAWGSACPGYEEIRKRVERKVEGMMAQLIKEALHEVEIVAHAERAGLPTVCKSEI